MNTATTATDANSNDVVDAEVIETKSENPGDNGAEDEDWAERAPFTAAFLRQFETARDKLKDQLETSQKNLDDLQKRARDLVDNVQDRVEKVGDRVREEGKEAGEKLDGMRRDIGENLGEKLSIPEKLNLGEKLKIGDKWPLRIDLESWLKLPVEAREEVLAALGIASEAQVSKLQRSVDMLREETTVLVEAQTSVLREIIVENAKAPARKATTRKAAAKKTTRKTAAKTTTRKAPVKKASARKTAAKKPASKATAAKKTATTTSAKDEVARA